MQFHQIQCNKNKHINAASIFFLAVWVAKVNVTTRSTICMIKSEGVREKTRVYLDYLNRIILENSSGLKMEKFKLARF